MSDVRAVVRAATARLADAGVATPRVDATLLVGHVLGLDPAETARVVLLGRPLTPRQVSEVEALVERRATRVPLQHLTGRAAFRRIELSVGPGVFVPRPETEGAVDLVLAELARLDAAAPVVVDLCTGSGALALAVKDERPDARVSGVELSPVAFERARANADDLDLDVTFMNADATLDPRSTVLSSLVGAVDVVVSNPPYIPLGAVPRDPEVRDHDPEMALYGGSDDGLAIPVAVARTAAALLRPGGLLVMEHADAQGEALPAALARLGCYTEVVDHLDLSGRPRHTTARRC